MNPRIALPLAVGALAVVGLGGREAPEHELARAPALPTTTTATQPEEVAVLTSAAPTTTPAPTTTEAPTTTATAAPTTTTEHVHPPEPEPEPAVAEPEPAELPGGPWQALAECESGGDWGIATGNGYYGGLQFHPQTWTGHGGGEYAPSAHQATPAQQVVVAERVLASQGWNAWPSCSRKLGLR